MLSHGYAAHVPMGPLLPFSYPIGRLCDHDVLVKITHSGLCHTDLYMIDNAWGRSSYPLVPGHEIVGIVEKAGPLALHQVGERVGIGWVYRSCMECPCCHRGETNICPSKQSLYTQGRHGGFASHITIDSRFAYPIPQQILSEHAAPLLCAGATVYAPIHRYQINSSHAIGVIGIGGLGHLALQFFHKMGCSVAAISSSPSKKEEALRLGANAFYLNKAPKESFDFLFYTSDGPLNATELFSFLKPNGTLCLLSRPPPFSIDPKEIVSMQKSLSSSNNASGAVIQEMLAFAATASIAPQIELMAPSQINEAIEKLKKNQVRYRVVFKMLEQ